MQRASDGYRHSCGVPRRTADIQEGISKRTDQWYAAYPLSPGFDENLAYFKRSSAKNAEFWGYFGGTPDLAGKTALEIGCGHGSLCLYTAQSVPSCRVIGIDTDIERIDFATWNLHVNYTELEQRVQFRCVDAGQLPVLEVDAVFSKATFEHILELDKVLSAVRARLKMGGRLYTGFSPLYHSPFGGHGRIHNALPIPWLPWGHLLFPEGYVLDRVNRSRDRPASSITELGLNKLSVGEYRRVFEESGLRVVELRTNFPAKSVKAKVLGALSRMRPLEKYTTHSICAVLEKTA